MDYKQTVSRATAARIPAYLRYLKGEAGKGVEYVSSAAIARDMGYSAVGVRKDLALVSSAPGKPRLGFEVKQLICDIEHFLGYHELVDAIIVGAGGLGRAILTYDGFANYGINIVAAFDNSPSRIGAIGDKTVYPIERLEEIVKRHNIKVGVLTVPRNVAQQACNDMVRAGITSILNFAPVYLQVKEGIRVKYEDLAVSLAELCGGPQLD
jgi:redox-sensing transcriptional repressor